MSKPLARARIGALISGILAVTVGLTAVLLSTGAFVWDVDYAAESFLYNTFGALSVCTVLFWGVAVCAHLHDQTGEHVCALHRDVKALRAELQRIRRTQVADARGGFTDDVVRRLGLVEDRTVRPPAARRPTD